MSDILGFLRTLLGNPCRHKRVLDNLRSCIVCTNAAESGVAIPDLGVVISSGVCHHFSMDVRTGATVNALQTLSKSQMTQQMGRTGRVDEGDHITMMSHTQLVEQVRARRTLQQLDESDLSPMVLLSLVSGRSLRECPPPPTDWSQPELRRGCFFMESS